jgi:hypothetical protein
MKGYGFKQADQLSARFLNDVNDASVGGALVSLPVGVQSAQVSATAAGDAIIMDDATAGALSDSTVGTLFGGTYLYMGTFSGAAVIPARGKAAFFRATDLPVAGVPGTAGIYQISSDAQPTTAIPTLFAGVFLNSVTNGNFGWIQTAGVASCLFDSAITAAAVGNPVSVKISAAVPSTFDVGVTVVTATIAFSYAGAFVGTAITLPVVSTVTAVLVQRSPFSRT